MAADGLGADVGQNPTLVAAATPRSSARRMLLPVLAKMTPNLGNMEPPPSPPSAPAPSGIAAINTIKSVMNVNLETFSSGPDVAGVTSVGGYSGKAVKPIALRFIQSLKGRPRLAGVPVSGMGSIETWQDAAEFIAMGCESDAGDHGRHAVRLPDHRGHDPGPSALSGRAGHEGITRLVGRALPRIVPADDLDRETVCRLPKFDRAKCVGCGRCRVSADDAGHRKHCGQGGGARPCWTQKCVGCHLCVAVCPVEAVSQGPR